jgi:hypothetical protein
VGIVDEAVADGIGDARIADMVVPLLDGELAGDDGRARGGAIVEDLVEVAPFGVVDLDESPVVEDEDVDAGDLGEETPVGSVGASEGELVEES